ncbi:putative RNA exonuclease Rex3 [Aspergillus campestris IBT 28561]|uniref:RNA exonuclease 3 n=1 Tax=Aspergillus campestris (strain IBT 28561) TaxID=1392248 RepID=A0A2I1DFC8_ASPC2|nr:putative RNA exonuclease Rex3 [Aspergillus campestris IBT 28561]PKY08579.1 putative RNA exonuclease Rex3 [Aspergillus campestris IBT 28561]
MFATLGLFKEVPCPEGSQCSLMTCMFSHESVNPPFDEPSAADDSQPMQIDDTTAEAPARKKPKLDASVTKSSGFSQKDQSRPSPKERPSPAPKSQSSVPRDSPAVAMSTQATAAPSQSRLPPRRAPKESLNPRMIPKTPATHGVRLSILTKLHGAMTALNNKVAKDKDSTEKYLILTPNELVTMALDEEEKFARENASIYGNVIKLRIVKLSKMSTEDWVKEVKAHLNDRYYKLAPATPEANPKAFTTGMTVNEEIALASQLITPLNGLENHGYVTRAPTQEEVEGAKKGVIESKGWEKCDRCGGRFQVFPGRREDGSLTTGGKCTYHPGKPLYPTRKQTDHITGHREAYYSCCNETLGTSSGCTKGNSHVFKVSETKRLASILQFAETPAQPDKGPQSPVCFDCEMGYTTLGLELIRLTAVSWPEGKPLLDVLVRPIGEVLDLNSRFSGVFPEHYTKAIPYGSTPPSQEESAPLQVVESPAAARSLLFSLLQPDTPLIGHAIDNDLNASRIIHPTIIDTVLLYPHPRGLPLRTSLKILSKRYLDRDIQTGGNRGHDSREDAVATGDLVRVKAAETWKTLRAKGWRIEGVRLVPPPGVTASGPVRGLGPGAGHKRGSGG